MGCGLGLLKCILITVNVVFFLAGASILGVGIWLRVDKTLEQFQGDTSLKEFRTALYTSAYILIGLGSFTFVVGFLGCCGAIKDSKCLLGIYIALVGTILAAEIGGGVYAYTQKDKVIEAVKTAGGEYLKSNYVGNDSTDLPWNVLMIKFECCGFGGPDDFKNSKYTNTTKNTLPLACCTQKRDISDGQPDPVDAVLCQNKTSNYYNESCTNALIDFFQQYSTIALGVAGGVVGFEFLMVLFTICYCCKIDDDK